MKENQPHTNRLIREKSPYLLQHAHNPVDWYPWGQEAFHAAKELDRPIFLSIGYSTCHWCHVMDQECFHNPEIAKKMNEIFVNIKVDREERPEIDSLYMEFAQAMMTGGAGWPLNVILTPDLTPFFATTFLPAETQKGFLGLKQLIERIQKIWEDPEEREVVFQQAGKIVDIFSKKNEEVMDELPSTEKIEVAAEALYKTADPIYGGMRGAPKFPVGFQGMFLLRYGRVHADSRALFFVERSLEMMHRGGIYDHLGGGFSRYAVDDHWMVPHFEKMSADNAILARVYADTYAYTRQNFYREVCIEILEYLRKELLTDKGYFCSAQDADIRGQEGAYYTWTWEELQQALKEDAPLFCEFFGASPSGNFKGKNILHRPFQLVDFSEYRRLDAVVLNKVISQMRSKLLEEREKRDSPIKDDKAIVAYNALTITSFCLAGRLFSKQEYLEIAKKVAEFIDENLWDGDILYRSWRDGQRSNYAILDDYAYLLSAYLTLFEHDQGEQWLKRALEIEAGIYRDFLSESGGYYLTRSQADHLILRKEEYYDGSEPSGNGIHAENLLKLSQITGNPKFYERCRSLLVASKDHLDLYPPGACSHLMALMHLYDTNAPTLVITLNSKEDSKKEIQQILGACFVPHLSVVWYRPHKSEQMNAMTEIVKGKTCIQDKTTFYLCYPDRCHEPITDISQMWELFDGLK